MDILRINMQAQTAVRQAVPPAWNDLGGRGLIARIMLDEVSPRCDPLGAENKLIFAPGLLAGLQLSSCDRCSAGAKSPLTGGIKESNSGGTTGLHLHRLEIKALILEGMPSIDGWHILHITRSGVQFLPADGLAGKGVYASARYLLERFGNRVAVILIGPAGEKMLTGACISNVDVNGSPTRVNGRGGLGAVMGSKHIKAIILDASDCPLIHPLQAAEFKELRAEYHRVLMEQPQIKTYHDFGTAGILQLANLCGVLPNNNYSSGQSPLAENLSAETLRELLLARGGKAKTTSACMPGCLIQCSNCFADKNGDEVVSALEYETIAMLGSNLGIFSLDDVARLNHLVNDIGLDSIETGAALGVAAESGCVAFGNAGAFADLLHEVAAGTPRGQAVGNGASAAGRFFKVERVPVVKNQSLAAYDPRAVKGTGVTYATSPMGADHTAGLTLRAKIDHLDPKIQTRISFNAQLNMAGYDTLGACIFAGFGFGAAPHLLPKLMKTGRGWDVPTDIIQMLGKSALQMEREFNRLAGFTPEDDRLPKWMCREPLPPTGAVFDVTDEDLDHVFTWD